MRPPLNGKLLITQLFGGNPNTEQYKNSNGILIIGHDGIDIAASLGQAVYCAWDTARVEVINDSTGFGLHVKLHDTTKQRYALYGHLSAVSVVNGAIIHAHESFARAGSTGNSTGPHVHFGIYPDNQTTNNGYGGAVDPVALFDPDVWPMLDLSLTNL